MIRRLVTALWAALAAFHAYLLACQAVDGRLLDGGVLFRWCVAFGLVAGVIGMRGIGTSPWSRRAVAPWLLAMLLHGPAVLDRVGIDMPAAPQAVSVVAGAAALGAGLCLLSVGLAWRSRRTTAGAVGPRPVAHRGIAPLASWSSLVLAARPPPLV